MPAQDMTVFEKALAPVLLQLSAIASCLQSVSSSVQHLAEGLVKHEEANQRRKNVVFKGKVLKDSIKETANDTKVWAETIFKRIGVDVTLVRAVRLGKYRPGFNRPVLCVLATVEEKDLAMSNRCNLKGSDVWINCDLPKELRWERMRARLEKKTQEEATRNVELRGGGTTAAIGSKCSGPTEGGRTSSTPERAKEIVSTLEKPTSRDREEARPGTEEREEDAVFYDEDEDTTISTGEKEQAETEKRTPKKKVKKRKEMRVEDSNRMWLRSWVKKKSE